LQIGLVIRRFLPKVANVLAKMLKPIGKHTIFVCLFLKNCLINISYFVFVNSWHLCFRHHWIWHLCESLHDPVDGLAGK
jgi:hypothetical protein